MRPKAAQAGARKVGSASSPTPVPLRGQVGVEVGGATRIAMQIRARQLAALAWLVGGRRRNAQSLRNLSDAQQPIAPALQTLGTTPPARGDTCDA